MATNFWILSKRVVNKLDSSSSFTKRVKGENYFVILNIDDVVVKMQGTCFKGKVMNMYQSVDN
jgi:predicted aspartyl protease